jgi:hypothetical protein
MLSIRNAMAEARARFQRRASAIVGIDCAAPVSASLARVIKSLARLLRASFRFLLEPDITMTFNDISASSFAGASVASPRVERPPRAYFVQFGLT